MCACRVPAHVQAHDQHLTHVHTARALEAGAVAKVAPKQGPYGAMLVATEDIAYVRNSQAVLPWFPPAVMYV